MNIKDTLEEIGILEVNLQIEKYLNNKNLLSDLSSEMPIPNECTTSEIIDNAISKIMTLRKRNLFMLSNEIAFIERIEMYNDIFDNIIVGLSRNLKLNQISNIKNNVSKKIKVSFVNELEYPTILRPKNSVILVFGYISGNNCLISENTYRMLELYKSFAGKKIFIKCIDSSISARPKGWISINGQNYFDEII